MKDGGTRCGWRRNGGGLVEENEEGKSKVVTQDFVFSLTEKLFHHLVTMTCFSSSKSSSDDDHFCIGMLLFVATRMKKMCGAQIVK